MSRQIKKNEILRIAYNTKIFSIALFTILLKDFFGN